VLLYDYASELGARKLMDCFVILAPGLMMANAGAHRRRAKPTEARPLEPRVRPDRVI